MTFYYIDYDHVEALEGSYDALYGSVSPDDKGHLCAPRNYYQMGVDVWKTRQEAIDALLTVCHNEFLKAQRRLVRARQEI